MFLDNFENDLSEKHSIINSSWSYPYILMSAVILTSTLNFLMRAVSGETIIKESVSEMERIVWSSEATSFPAVFSRGTWFLSLAAVL